MTARTLSFRWRTNGAPLGAERLEAGAVQDVRADRIGRLEAEHDHENRRHQRAAAHPGETDEHADQEAREGELPGHRSTTPLAVSSSGRDGFAGASVGN